MPLPVSKLTPEREAELRALLEKPRPDPKTMTSLDRILRVNLYKEMMQGGIEVPEEHLAYGVELLAVDRADRTSSAAAERKIAKKAGNGAANPALDASDL